MDFKKMNEKYLKKYFDRFIVKKFSLIKSKISLFLIKSFYMKKINHFLSPIIFIKKKILKYIKSKWNEFYLRSVLKMRFFKSIHAFPQ